MYVVHPICTVQPAKPFFIYVPTSVTPWNCILPTRFPYSFCVISWISNCSVLLFVIDRLVFARRGADRSLARPGGKQATANKFGIYSTHSPRSSIHFLDTCSNFCKPLKKILNVVCSTSSRRQQWPPRRTKNGDLSIFFSVQGTGGSPTGPPTVGVGTSDLSVLHRFYWRPWRGWWTDF